MKKKTDEQCQQSETMGSDDPSPHPLDEWLRRELETLFSDEKDEPLPPDMAELAVKLERALAKTPPRNRTS